MPIRTLPSRPPSDWSLLLVSCQPNLFNVASLGSLCHFDWWTLLAACYNLFVFPHSFRPCMVCSQFALHAQCDSAISSWIWHCQNVLDFVDQPLIDPGSSISEQRRYRNRICAQCGLICYFLTVSIRLNSDFTSSWSCWFCTTKTPLSSDRFSVVRHCWLLI